MMQRQAKLLEKFLQRAVFQSLVAASASNSTGNSTAFCTDVADCLRNDDYFKQVVPFLLWRKKADGRLSMDSLQNAIWHQGARDMIMSPTGYVRQVFFLVRRPPFHPRDFQSPRPVPNVAGSPHHPLSARAPSRRPVRACRRVQARPPTQSPRLRLVRPHRRPQLLSARRRKDGREATKAGRRRAERERAAETLRENAVDSDAGCCAAKRLPRPMAEAAVRHHFVQGFGRVPSRGCQNRPLRGVDSSRARERRPRLGRAKAQRRGKERCECRQGRGAFRDAMCQRPGSCGLRAAAPPTAYGRPRLVQTLAGYGPRGFTAFQTA